MKKLTELFLFSALSPNVRESIVRDITNDLIIDNHKVEESSIQDQTSIIQRRYKYSSKNAVITDYSRNDTVMVYDEKMSVPAFIPAWLMMKNGNVLGIGNLSLYSKMEEKNLNIDVKKLFGIMQAATTLRNLQFNQNKVINNVALLKNLSFVYSRMFSRCLDRLYSLNLDPVQADRVSYLTSKFFLMYVVGKPLNSTVEGIALGNVLNDTPVSSIERMNDEFEFNFDKIDEFVEDLSKAIPSLSNANIRPLTETWTRMYGDTTILGIESFQYFLVSIFSVATGVSVNNETIINNLASKQIQNAYLEFFRITK